MQQSAVSHQLRLLRAIGLVATQRAGRHITYSLYDNHVASLLDEAVYHAEHLRLGTPDRPANVGWLACPMADADTVIRTH